MYKIELDPETGGIILRDKKAILNHEVRPVYAGELLELGAQNYWYFDEESDAPFMFADLGRFYYRGQEAFRTLKGDDGKPRVAEKKIPNGRTLEPIDVPAMSEKNAMKNDDANNNSHSCQCCRKTLDKTEIGACLKILGRSTTYWFCLPCLAERLETTTDYIEEMIGYWKEQGCALFS